MHNSSVKGKRADQATLLFAGDYHIYGNYDKVRGKFDEFIKKNPEHCLFDDNIKKLVQQSDLAVFNLEDPISVRREGIVKHGPHGVGSPDSLIPVSNAGFNVATFATNHSYDMGQEGIETTRRECSKKGIDLLGVGLDIDEARKAYFREINGIKVSILNFSRVEYNAATESRGGANPLDVVTNTKDIIDAKKQSDYVILVVHEGLDTFHLPYPALIKQMRFYADMGADAILLHHSRIVSGYEIYENVPIFYGLGNLLHMSRDKREHEGLIVEFHASCNKLAFQLHPVHYSEATAMISLTEGARSEQILDKIEELSIIIRDPYKLKVEWDSFVYDRRALYTGLVNGIPSILHKIFRKSLLKLLYIKLQACRKKRNLALLNVLRCQAHLEALKRSFEYLVE